MLHCFFPQSVLGVSGIELCQFLGFCKIYISSYFQEPKPGVPVYGQVRYSLYFRMRQSYI